MEDHEHRFYMQPKTYTEFVPFYDSDHDVDWPKLYQRNEWAILSCNCGVVKRVLVKDA